MKDTTEHEFTKDIGHKTEGTLELEEMFEEYANNYSRIYDLLLKNENSTLIRRFRNENEQIIQEATKQIQSDLLKEVIHNIQAQFRFTRDIPSTEFNQGLEISIKNIKKLAEEKGLKHY